MKDMFGIITLILICFLLACNNKNTIHVYDTAIFGKKLPTYFIDDINMKSGEFLLDLPVGGKKVYLSIGEGLNINQIGILDSNLNLIDGAVQFHNNGVIKQVVNRESNGSVIGKKVDFYSNGMPQSITALEKGSEIGLVYYFDTTGILYESSLANEDGFATSYHKNGVMSATGETVDGKVDGEWRFYYANGLYKKSVQYLKGIKIE